MSADAVSEPAEPKRLNFRKALVMAALAVMGFTVFAALLGWLFREPLVALGQWFVASFGGPGIAVGFFIPDAFTVPMPNDAFTAFGLWGGMPFWEVVAWGSLGSLAGGSAGWLLGRYLIARSHRLEAFMRQRGGDDMREHLRQGGRWFLAVAAVTPIPYSITCWAAGATKLPFVEFLTISLLRVPRVALFLWLIQRGFLTIAG
ncbi:VTT domain-containing protein [Pseudenhygromyxa sp. WMMC2535]|uniref:YqaA family protein n=1 Tax=Pseudenhygromyxa sp. WMMC2535 TaxID=2712867 RepID=UPI001557424E|nr:VTT domain-containing protein [Pseudenhygromyxa sp. WMMC2535]NVB42019.1 VTT domain-containing protein [Pseudenhygromyxa sp. WMMC2535]